MQILDGKEVSKKCKKQIFKQVQALKAESGRAPCLAVVLVGDDPASQVYVRNKIKSCEEAGILSKEVRLPSDVTQAQLEEHIKKLNNDDSVHAYLVQLPLPETLDKTRVLDLIDPLKDADGLTTSNLGLLFASRPRVVPCTPKGVMKILEHYNIELAGKRAVVIGRSQIVGLPMAHLLLGANATVTVCHSKTAQLSEVTRLADIVIAAAGKPEFLTTEYFKKNAVVIDVGIHRKALEGDKSKLCGDVNFDDVKDHLLALTPVPGGVGPMTIAMLLQNTLELFKLRLQV